MVDVSFGCTNTNTYGISCVKCGECGRKFTSNGIDDSEVVNKKVEEYRKSLDSELYKDMSLMFDGDTVSTNK